MKTRTKLIIAGSVVFLGVGILGVVTAEPEIEEAAAPTTTTTEAATTTTVAPSTTTTTEVTSTTYPEEVVNEAFVLAMRSYSADLELVTWVDVVDDEFLIEWGNLFCFQMDNHGGVWEDAVMYALDAGVEAFGDAWNEDDTIMVAFGSGAAIQGYCPWYEVPENPWPDA